MTTSIFLSASIPDPKRDPRYHSTADVIAIRDAVKALATVVLPHATLVWGGHPAITPLIRAVVDSVGSSAQARVRLFQSRWFSDELPADNAAFERYTLTPREATREESIETMRTAMIEAGPFDAALFIGGMEGVEQEFAMLRKRWPETPVLPIASTGAAAAILFERERGRLGLPDALRTQYAYPSLFRTLLHLPPTDRQADWRDVRSENP